MRPLDTASSTTAPTLSRTPPYSSSVLPAGVVMPSCPLVYRRKCAHGEGSKAFDLDRHSEELRTMRGQRVKSTQMLHDRNIRAQERRVHRSLTAVRAVDIMRVDSDHGDT